MINSKQIHCGQYKPYGDSFYVWEIETDLTAKEVVDWCFENLYKRRVPNSAEWHKNIRYGAEKAHDADYYFAGYYAIEKTENGFKFTICKPFTD